MQYKDDMYEETKERNLKYGMGPQPNPQQPQVQKNTFVDKGDYYTWVGSDGVERGKYPKSKYIVQDNKLYESTSHAQQQQNERQNNMYRTVGNVASIAGKFVGTSQGHDLSTSFMEQGARKNDQLAAEQKDAANRDQQKANIDPMQKSSQEAAARSASQQSQLIAGMAPGASAAQAALMVRPVDPTATLSENKQLQNVYNNQAFEKNQKAATNSIAATDTRMMAQRLNEQEGQRRWTNGLIDDLSKGYWWYNKPQDQQAQGSEQQPQQPDQPLQDTDEVTKNDPRFQVQEQPQPQQPANDINTFVQQNQVPAAIFQNGINLALGQGGMRSGSSSIVNGKNDSQSLSSLSANDQQMSQQIAQMLKGKSWQEMAALFQKFYPNANRQTGDHTAGATADIPGGQ